MADLNSPELVRLASTALLDETIEELRAVALRADDALGYFPAMYARVTDRIRTEVSTDHFSDPNAMTTFAQAFAAWYQRPRRDSRRCPAVGARHRTWQAIDGC